MRVITKCNISENTRATNKRKKTRDSVRRGAMRGRRGVSKSVKCNEIGRKEKEEN